MRERIQVKCYKTDKVQFYDARDLELKIGDVVVFETDEGEDFGEVCSEKELILDTEIVKPLKKVKRIFTQADEARIKDNKEKEKEAYKTCQRKIKDRELEMKLVNVNITFDRSKMLFYFTAEERIDFRELVKDLAHIYRTRIELKQIGVRDEAKMLGGCGLCGLPICCRSYLKEFIPVSIRMAKDQQLPLNPEKISGLCGRLLCCLMYEYDNYKDLKRHCPKEGARVMIDKQQGKVKEVNVLKQTAYVELEDGSFIEVPVTHCQKARPGLGIIKPGKQEKEKPKGRRDDRGKRRRRR